MQALALIYFCLPLLALGAALQGLDQPPTPTTRNTYMPSPVRRTNTRPTPAPTGPDRDITTVHIVDVNDFSILAPQDSSQSVADAEDDAIAYCIGGCDKVLPAGFITAAAVDKADDGSWIQVTGCIDPSKMGMSPSDDGGQYDVRYPNGAKCSFGGYGASFIEQIEPSANRFCMRCCLNANDQTNCNSHNDRAGCAVTVPGTYDFPEIGVSCS